MDIQFAGVASANISIALGLERIRAAGYGPQVDLASGIGRYLDWIRSQSDVKDYFSEAAEILRSKGIVHRVAATQ